jgi:DNA/RNA-binding domain of Phe-tRNA-synthetase-like protein
VSAGGEAEAGWIAPGVAEEFPELRLWSLAVPARPGPSTPGLRRRLGVLSDRFHGARAIQLRRDPIPHAYRVFFRHIGLDPDAQRIPVEAAVVDRLMHGGFRSRGLLEDAAVIALVETGIPLWALDDARVEGDLGIDQAGDALVVADSAGEVCPLFAEPDPDRAPSPETTTHVRVFTVQVAGVPAIHVEEALFTCAEALGEG